MADMRLRVCGMVLAFLVLAGCIGGRQSAGNADLYGPMLRSQLPASFVAEYDTVHVQTEFVDLIRKAGEGVETLVFLGTWCSDSRHHVPRFLKVIDLARPSLQRVTLIGVDRNKKSPAGTESRYHIERVPTFIFMKNGEEIGRITESPQTTLEGDMLSILASGMSQ
jgi:hypothetical protein